MIIVLCITSYVLLGLLIPSVIYVFDFLEDMPTPGKTILFGLLWPVGCMVAIIVGTGLGIAALCRAYLERILKPLKQRHKAKTWEKKNAKAYKQSRSG